MSDMFWPSRKFELTHELKSLHHLHPGYSAECWCSYGTGYRRMAFFAILAHIRHSRKALKNRWAS